MSKLGFGSIIGKSIGYGFIASIVAYSGSILVIIASSNFPTRRDFEFHSKDNLRPNGI